MTSLVSQLKSLNTHSALENGTSATYFMSVPLFLTDGTLRVNGWQETLPGCATRRSKRSG